MILRLPAAAALLFLLPSLGSADPGPAAAVKTIHLALRYDDCSARSPQALEERILAACARLHVPVSFGVVPAVGAGDLKDPSATGHLSLPPERAARLVEASSQGVLEIALHGYAHRYARPGTHTEFAGVPAARQDSLIAAGTLSLSTWAGHPATFIPPWNSYDRATLAATAGHGLKTFSALAGGPSLADRADIAYAPATCLIPETRAAVLEARRRGGGIVVPYFHAFEFKDEDAARGTFTFAEFEATLAWLAEQPDVETKTLGALSALPETRREVYRGYSRWHGLTPAFLEKSMRPAYRVYPQAGFPIAGGGPLLRLVILLGYGMLAGFFASIARTISILLPALRQPGSPLILGVGSLAILLLTFSLWQGSAAWAGTAAAALGGCLGIWGAGNGVIRPNERFSGSQLRKIPI